MPPAARASLPALLLLLPLALLPGAGATHAPWHVFYLASDVCVELLPPEPVSIETAIDGGCTLKLLNAPWAYIHVHGPMGDSSPFVPFSFRFVDDAGAPCSPTYQSVGSGAGKAPLGCTHIWVAPRLGVVLLDTGQAAPWGEIWVY